MARQYLAPADFSHQRRLGALFLHRGRTGRSVQNDSLVETSEPVGHLKTLEIRLWPVESLLLKRWLRNSTAGVETLKQARAVRN